MGSIWEGREYCGYCWRTARLNQSPKKPILHPGNTKTGHGETRSPAVIGGSWEKRPLPSPVFFTPTPKWNNGTVLSHSPVGMAVTVEAFLGKNVPQPGTPF